MSSRASCGHASPLVCNDRVFVSFLELQDRDAADIYKPERSRSPGNLVVAAYDLGDNQLWLRRPGRFASIHGFCSSPVLYDDMVIVNGDHGGDAYLLALDKKTGKTRWRVDRTNRTRSYSTLITESTGRLKISDYLKIPFCSSRATMASTQASMDVWWGSSVRSGLVGRS